MNYPTKVQAIRRQKALSQCYVNLPLPLAAAIDIQPGEIVQWKVDTRYKLFLIRQRPNVRKEKNREGGFSAESGWRYDRMNGFIGLAGVIRENNRIANPGI